MLSLVVVRVIDIVGYDLNMPVTTANHSHAYYVASYRTIFALFYLIRDVGCICAYTFGGCFGGE